jgi:hypothetical protein
LPIAAKGLDLPFGLALLDRRGEAFGDRFAVYLIGQPRVWTVARIIAKVAMATRITTATTSPGNRPGAKIFQLRNLPQDDGPLSFQIDD